MLDVHWVSQVSIQTFHVGIYLVRYLQSPKFFTHSLLHEEFRSAWPLEEILLELTWEHILAIIFLNFWFWFILFSHFLKFIRACFILLNQILTCLEYLRTTRLWGQISNTLDLKTLLLDNKPHIAKILWEKRNSWPRLTPRPVKGEETSNWICTPWTIQMLTKNSNLHPSISLSHSGLLKVMQTSKIAQ